jgi:tetratricopeptide (TPR) repeat protein
LQIAQPYYLLRPVGADLLAETLLELGRSDAARAQIEDVQLPEANVGDVRQAWVLAIRGPARCRLGQTDRGIADLRSCGELVEDLRILNPTYLEWRSDLAISVAARSPEEAHHLVETELLLARRAGISSAIGAALRAYAALRPDQEAVDLLAQAVAFLEASPVILTRARALIDLGAALRRLGRRVEAREPLRQALEIAAACGAVPLADRAREEAILPGARPRRPRLRGLDALTPAELRTARLAAEGHTNREIAQALSSRPRPSATTSAPPTASSASPRERSSPRRWLCPTGRRVPVAPSRVAACNSAQPLQETRQWNAHCRNPLAILGNRESRDRP